MAVYRMFKIKNNLINNDKLDVDSITSDKVLFDVMKKVY